VCIRSITEVPSKNVVKTFHCRSIFKLTIGNEILHEVCNGNEVRVVNFATSKHYNCQEYNFLTSKIHKHSWASLDGKTLITT
jgi:hypothetical protein